MRIGLTSVYVRDPLEAFRFYTEVLGFVERLYVPEGRLAIVASRDEPDGTGLLLEPNDNPIGRTYQESLYGAGVPAIVFTSDDVQAEFQKLSSAGVTFRKQPTKADWGIEAVFDDSCGNLIQLAEIKGS